LTRDGFKEAKETAWDADTIRPISWEEQLLNEAGNDHLVWSGMKKWIMNLMEVLQEGQEQCPKQLDWQDEYSNSGSTFGYADQTIATVSTTGNEGTAEVLTVLYDKVFNPPPPDDNDKLTMETMDSVPRSTDKGQGYMHLQISQARAKVYPWQHLKQ